MRLGPLSLMGSSYADNSLTWSAQRTLNWLPETAEVEGTRTPIKFADIPGLRAVVDLGTGLPIRGLHNVEGKLFAVSSTSLFEISTSFGVTNRGNIPGVTRVSMAHNRQGGVVAANELVIANGLSGYVYNTSTATLSQITDDAFQGATTVDYVDGYITFTDPQGRFWGHSALNQATSFSSIDRYDAESAPDPIIAHIVSHREVMVFGTRTIEFFRNTGAATGTFQRVDGTELEVGICSPYARSRVDNSVCWVSDGLEVFRLEGHSPQRISDRPIEQLLATVNPANIFTFAWEDRGHKVFYVTAPEAFTIGFDFASGMWHERQTFDIPRWRANDLVSWNGLWIVGDFSNGLLYVLDWDTHHENGLPLVRERASGYTHGGQNKVLAPYVELLFDAGPDGDLPEIVGDVPDGSVGEAVSGTYVVSGGISPYGPITVLSGTFPPGLTLDPDGSYSGTYTTVGSYSWTVGGVDAFGQPFSTPDTAEVSALVNPWFLSVATVGTATNYRGEASADVWTLTTASAVSGVAYYFEGQLQLSNVGSVQYAYSVDKGQTWSAAANTNWPADGGRLAYFDGYIYAAAGNTPVRRRLLPAGDWSAGADTDSFAQDVVAHGDRLVAVYTGRNTASFSTDGLNWTLCSGTLNAAGNYNDAPRIASNGDRIVAVYSDFSDDLCKIKYSEDDGDTWSSVVYTFPGADPAKAAVDVQWDGTRWIALNAAGQVATSADNGDSWTLSADTLAGGRQIAVGTGMLLVPCLGGDLYSSVDNGVTWQVRTDPAGTTNIGGCAWVFP